MPNFFIGYRSREAVEIFDLAGELDAHTAPELDSAFRKCRQDGHNQIVVNGAKLRYISSAGLHVFLGFIDRVREDGGDIKICSLKENVSNVFDLLGMQQIFSLVNTEDEAIELFRATPV